MEEVLRAALDAADGNGTLAADVRVVEPFRFEQLAVRNGEASSLTGTTRVGVSVRVRRARAWGFAARSVVSPAAAREAAQDAVRVARAAERSARQPLAVVPSGGPAHGEYRTSLREDPFLVPIEEKLALLTEAEHRLHVSPAVKSGHAAYRAWSEEKWFASSEGVQFHSKIVQVGAGIDATAVQGREVQRRSAPTSFGGNFRQAGFEFIRSLDLATRAPLTGQEAVALLTAPACDTATTTVVLASDQLALQVHESVGHATELDRILGYEAGYAGTSFLAPSDREALRYGSPLMEVVANARELGGLGTFGWDDEGVPAQRTTLVHQGRLVGFLTSRETAAQLGLDRSGGTSRGDGPDRMPLIRMTNIDLLPGDQSFDELLDGVREGVFFETNRSWSIDDKRLNFQFGTEVGRRIERGELGGLVRNPIYSGMTPEFWASMDAVGNQNTWQLWGVPNCGKGQPSQAARVGHGAPAARFRSVRVRGG
ncbi:MAG TPA: TldD/PmbA family protein [Thermoplasmata archaeon]|nr:TldD/PmbA family protein [Thermoplasmata archaeon]